MSIKSNVSIDYVYDLLRERGDWKQIRKNIESLSNECFLNEYMPGFVTEFQQSFNPEQIMNEARAELNSWVVKKLQEKYRVYDMNRDR